MSVVSTVYLERGNPVTVLTQWAKGDPARNVTVQRADGTTAVRPFLGLRRTAPHECRCGCGGAPSNVLAEYIRGHRPRNERDVAYLKRCSAKECTSLVGEKGARGLCSKHYQSLLIHGRVKYGRRPRRPAIDRFLDFVRQAGECWEWTGGKDGCGYGMFSDRSLAPGSIRAHRWSYMYHVGEIPEGLHLDHLCRNRACVNPWHVEPVTPAINATRGALARRREFCPAQHPFDEENTYINPTHGGRSCRACTRASRARYDQKRKAA